MKKSKIVSLALAGTLAATALLAGTYAWTAISQKAVNEVTGEVNPGGRLHDDFNGENKDIYVENFTGRTEGEEGAVIYARIKLDEYLSIGSGAGEKAGDDNIVGGVKGTTTIENPDTWTTFTKEEESSSIFRNYFEWEWGGTTDYLPTFNKNKDSLEADINGTLEGENGVAYDDYETYTKGQKITDLEIYDADEDTDNEDEGLNEAILVALSNGNGGFNTTAVTTTATSLSVDLDGDGTNETTLPMKVEEDDSNKIVAVYVNLDKDYVKDASGQDTAEEEYDIKVVPSIEHEVDTTLPATVMTMAEWKAGGYVPGEYWVYDTDGWAYWAQGIAPGTATGCLLTGIDRKGSIVDKYYYAINVTAQFATAGDWGKGTANQPNPDTGEGFYIDGITEDGLYLLNTIAGEEKNILIGVPDGTSYNPATGVKPGETLQLDAKVMLGAQELSDSITWSLEEGTYTPNVTSIDPVTGLLSIGKTETKEVIKVRAALTRMPDKVYSVSTINVGQYYTVEVATANNAENLVVPENIKKLTLEATVTNQRGEADATAAGVTWELVGEYKEGTKIDRSTGELVIDDDEKATEIVVQAVSNKDDTATATFTVNVDTQIEYVAAISEDKLGLASTTVTIDGIEWYVLYKQDVDGNDSKEALLWATRSVTGWGGTGEINGWKFYDASGYFKYVAEEGDNSIPNENGWKYSNARAWLNSEGSESGKDVEGNEATYNGFLTDKEILKTNSVKVTIKTRAEYDLTGLDEENDFVETTDKVFLLTEADVYGTASGRAEEGAAPVAKGIARDNDYTVRNADGKGERLIKDVEGYTDNALMMIKSKDIKDTSWLRSPGWGNSYITFTDANGQIWRESYTYTTNRIRPALWLNLSGSSN